MTPEFLPPYVYDLISAVEQYEEEHGENGTCLHAALYRIPERDRDLARAIAAYKRCAPAYSEVHA